MTKINLDRRALLKTAGLGSAALAMPHIFIRKASAANTLTIADAGGTTSQAVRKAFAEPFEKASGVQVVQVAREADPVTQFKLLVDSKTYLWDACMMTQDHQFRLQEGKNYIEPLEIKDDAHEIADGMLTADWFGFSVFAIMFAYRSDKYGQNGPKNWKDFFDAGAFPGRRGLYRNGWGMIEMALLADGVPKEKLYPLDVDRAFQALERIKKNVAVWWSSGAQNTQILQSGEVDMSDTWSSRLYSAILGGAKLTPVWQGLYSADGWALPAGGPKTKLARDFVRFCMRAENQAIYANEVANGPTNKKAFDFIPVDRAKLLATYPENLTGLSALDSQWWSQKNREMVRNRIEKWLRS